MTATRRQAREWAIQMLTAADLNPPDDRVQFFEDFWSTLASFDESEGGIKVGGKLKLFAEERVSGVLDNIAEIDSIVAKMLENWEMYRLGTVERAVIRMGIWEIKYSDVPPPVVINEAVDLTNWFSAPKSKTIVNGILDKYAKACD